MLVKLTKAAQTAQTRRIILDHVRPLFVSQGYAATGTEQMITGLGITRGALYHQFGDKQGVFRAVIEEVFAEMAEEIDEQAKTGKTAWKQLLRGCYAFLDIAQREEIRRLLFIEAPAVLDAATLSEFDRRYGYGLLLNAIQSVVEAGELEVLSIEGFAMMLNGALDQLAAWVAQTESVERVKAAKIMTKQLLTLHRKN